MKHANLALLGFALVLAGIAKAHHSVPAEYGDSSTPYNYIEGTIQRVAWANPHIFINMSTTGGDLEAGENWRLTTHPVNIMTGTYGFEANEFAVGDSVKVYGWFHLRGQPLFQIRAISINDGPMRSTLRFTDLREIVSGKLQDSGIVPTEYINGTDPGRAGPEAVAGLHELGYLDEDGNVNLPDQILYPD